MQTTTRIDSDAWGARPARAAVSTSDIWPRLWRTGGGVVAAAGLAVLATPNADAAAPEALPGVAQLAPVRGLAGRNGMLAVGTDGGVALHDLQAGTTRWISTDAGLPSATVRAVALAEDDGSTLAATAAGLGRGSMNGPWEAAGGGMSFLAGAARPGGGFVAGGDNGRLVCWVGSGCDSLALPGGRGRVVAVAFSARLLDPAYHGLSDASLRADRVACGDPDVFPDQRVPAERLPPEPSADVFPGRLVMPPYLLAPDEAPAGANIARPHATASEFPTGMVVATERDGLWILRGTSPNPRWLQLGMCDGLPGAALRALAVDARDRVWVATDGGVVRLDPGALIAGWPHDSLLVAPTRALAVSPHGRLFLGLLDGIVRVDIEADPPHAERLIEWPRPVVAVAWSHDRLWWSDGSAVRALDPGGPPLRRRPGASEVRSFAAGAGMPASQERSAHVADGAGARAAVGAPTAPHTLLVFDVRGRELRRVAWRDPASARWDGRDAAGKPAASGVYWLRIVDAAGRSAGAQRVLRLR